MHNKWPSPPTAAAVSGVTYTRWGRTSCPNDTEAQLVYSGRAGGTKFTAQGGSAEKICLPDDPNYTPESANIPSQFYKGLIQGVEYEVSYPGQSTPLQHLHEQNAPCAVCDVPIRARVIVVPAKTVCPPSWTREYYGYLMTEYDGHYRSSYTCVDIDAEPIPGESSDTDPSLFYHTATNCNGLLCPPYEDNRLLSCVVCTK